MGSIELSNGVAVEQNGYNAAQGTSGYFIFLLLPNSKANNSTTDIIISSVDEAEDQNWPV